MNPLTTNGPDQSEILYRSQITRVTSSVRAKAGIWHEEIACFSGSDDRPILMQIDRVEMLTTTSQSIHAKSNWG